MIKKHRVIKQEQIVLYCDSCGTQLNNREIDMDAKDGKYYVYTCPVCNKVYHEDVCFPFTRLTFEQEGEVVNKEDVID